MKINKINSAVLCSEKKALKTKFYTDNPNIPTEELTKTPPLIPITFLGRSNKYLTELAVGLSTEIGEKIKPSQLKSVMTKEEFLKQIPKLTEQNFVASTENIRNGTFIADLHCHTNYSDGRISVQNMLDQAAEYGNRLKNINGKKFIFALTDHDGIKGVVEALKIIAKNPKKYENIKFIPASELSFVVHCEDGSKRAHKYRTDVQMPEALIYNINPFSETSKTFFNDLYSNRKKQTELMIKEANELIRDGNFSVKEYNKYVLKKRDDDYFIMNQHWHIMDYIITKTNVVEAAKKQMKGVRDLTREIISDLQKKNIKPYSFNIYNQLKSKRLITESIMPRFAYDKLVQKFFPHSQGKNVKTNVEHSFADIVNYAQREDAQLALAHPAYFLQNFKLEDGYQRLGEYIEKSNGRLNFIEKYHQAYHIDKNRDIQTEQELKDYNKIIDRYNLVNIGGRDNHSIDFTKFQDVIHVGENWV